MAKDKASEGQLNDMNFILTLFLIRSKVNVYCVKHNRKGETKEWKI